MTAAGNNSVFNKILQQSSNAFLVSAEKGDIKEFCNLLATGVDPVAAKGRNDFTALHYAASRGHLAIVQELLYLGVPVDVRTKDGETPLHVAVYAGHMLVVEQLLDHHADINAVNQDNETPLFYASSQGRPLIIRVLLQRGADPAVVDNVTEDTALARAKDKRTEQMFALLLEAQASGPSATCDSPRPGLARSASPATAAGAVAGLAGFLPYSAILLIFRFVDSRTVCRAGAVNSKWFRVSQDSALWDDNRDIGMKRWEYALRHAMGVQPTSTSFLSFNKPRSTKNRGISRPSSSGDVLAVPAAVPGARQPSLGEGDTNPRVSTKNSSIVSASGNGISDFF
jgi:hypothetical protein